VDALSQYSLDTENLKKLEGIENSVSEVVLRAAKRSQETSRIAIGKAERALRAWMVSDKEIDAVREEAKRIIARKKLRDPDSERVRQNNWARVEIDSPIHGMVVEKNVNPGNIIDSTQDLFKIADLTSLAVYVHIYEEDQPELQKLQKRYAPGLVPWRLYLTADPRKQPIPSPGIKRLSPIVDPTQHTSLAVGSADNKDGRLTVGQFVTAEVDIPAPPGVVSIPVGALDEDGATSHVLIQLDPDHHRYALRRVRVLHRFLDFAYVSSKLSESDRAAGLSALEPGMLIVNGGAVQLKPALEDAQTRAKAKK
jgi:membrane fusion protein, heavy metal efflux system